MSSLVFADQQGGTFGSTTLADNGNRETLVAHLTSAGAFDWAYTFGKQDAKGIISDGSGGAIVVGIFKGTLSALGISSNGNFDVRYQSPNNQILLCPKTLITFRRTLKSISRKLTNASGALMA